ncbi:MAG: NAD(P)-dependent oxidoreductase [Ruminococcaceae bacterium]|nr:NAD(P)-dependent oxidoreductase [Oscillospiraceae bacterium]
MNKALVGYTGFVGSNIYAAGDFSGYNTKNIKDSFGTKPDLLIYAGLRAEKFLANKEPEKDYELIAEAYDNIMKIGPKKLVLISTVDVIKDPDKADEDVVIETEGLQPYGLNRYLLEKQVREEFPDALIIRLPGLFGKNIKKNFIYDLINVIPGMLRADKFEELSAKEPVLKNCYRLLDNGFYKADVPEDDREMLKDLFRKLGFTALNFTDSRNVYQFYDLGNLWKAINTALENGITLWHPATEPVSAAEVYRFVTGSEFENELSNTPVCYDFRTKYSELFGGKDGYICGKEEVLEGIRRFVLSMTSKKA